LKIKEKIETCVVYIVDDVAVDSVAVADEFDS
jgi:hypothetical protein